MKTKKIIDIVGGITIIVFMFHWIGIMKALVIFGESHLYEPNIVIAISELIMVCLATGWFILKSIRWFNNLRKTIGRTRQ